MALTKNGMAEDVYQKLPYTKKEALQVVEDVFEVIQEALAGGEKVKISGLGNFVLKDKKERRGRNPQSGEEMEIDARRVLLFRPSATLKEDLASRYQHRLDEKGGENISMPPKRGGSRALKLFMTNENREEF